MSDPVDLRKPHRPIRVGVILLNSKTEVLDLAPIDLLNGLTKEFVEDLPLPEALKKEALDIDFHWVTETGKSAQLTAGLTIAATDDFASCPPLDITLMGANTMIYTPNEAELEFIRKSYDQCAVFLNICGGMIPAATAGVLKGKTCTGPRVMLPSFREQYPDTTWVERRYVHDEKVWTSGALLNGLDMMRAFVTDTWGNEGVGALAQFLLQFGHFPDRHNDYSDAVSTL